MDVMYQGIGAVIRL